VRRLVNGRGENPEKEIGFGLRRHMTRSSNLWTRAGSIVNL